MQTHGYERSQPWRLALALLDQVNALANTFQDDTLGLGGKLRALAAELPVRAALCFEADDYQSVKQHAEDTGRFLFKLLLQAQIAEHTGLLHARQVKALRIKLDGLDDALAALPDELFEDDGEPDTLTEAA